MAGTGEARRRCRLGARGCGILRAGMLHVSASSRKDSEVYRFRSWRANSLRAFCRRADSALLGPSPCTEKPAAGRQSSRFVLHPDTLPERPAGRPRKRGVFQGTGDTGPGPVGAVLNGRRPVSGERKCRVLLNGCWEYRGQQGKPLGGGAARLSPVLAGASPADGILRLPPSPHPAGTRGDPLT